MDLGQLAEGVADIKPEPDQIPTLRTLSATCLRKCCEVRSKAVSRRHGLSFWPRVLAAICCNGAAGSGAAHRTRRLPQSCSGWRKTAWAKAARKPKHRARELGSSWISPWATFWTGVSSEAIDAAQQKAEEAATKGTPYKRSKASKRRGLCLFSSSRLRVRLQRVLTFNQLSECGRPECRAGSVRDREKWGDAKGLRLKGGGGCYTAAATSLRPWSRSPRIRRWSPRPRR